MTAVKQNAWRSGIRLKECLFRLGSPRLGMWKGNSEVEAKIQVMNVIASEKVRAMTSGAKSLCLLSQPGWPLSGGLFGAKAKHLTYWKKTRQAVDPTAEPWAPQHGPLFWCGPFPKLVAFLSFWIQFTCSSGCPRSQEKELFQQMDFAVTISKAIIYLDFLILLLYLSPNEGEVETFSRKVGGSGKKAMTGLERYATSQPLRQRIGQRWLPVPWFPNAHRNIYEMNSLLKKYYFCILDLICPKQSSWPSFPKLLI